ncbi:MAG: flagellar protein export ATPase FliI [Clostridiaceae bacterium]|nr:flagellar protein export ATPase FliI [Clostridiaceae bacterium]
MNISFDFKEYEKILENTESVSYYGEVCRVIGLTVESIGPHARVGEVCLIYPLKEDASPVEAEVVGFKDNNILLMPYGELSCIGPGSKVVSTNRALTVPVGMGFIGRILDGLGKPMDDKGDIRTVEYYNVDNSPPDPLKRERIREVLPLGIKAIDGLLTCGRGQRIGLFAGSGVGKSTLLGMIARNAKADVNVITLVGERGREVRDYIEKDLKEEGLKKSVLVIATSDRPALVRVRAAMIGTSIAEYFRDKGLNVLFLMDSLTRFAMAQREIGMTSGEPPVSRGYTPSVFATLPRLLERTGNSDKGSITGIYTVLVDGDDMNEPIADTVRGILDGHIVLSRALANRNHYPAIDILASVSRVMPDIVSKEHITLANKVRGVMSVYRDVYDLITIGAYKKGTNPEIDRSIDLHKEIEAFLCQGIEEGFAFEDTLNIIRDIFAGE